MSEDSVEIETKQWGRFKFDKHTGTRTWYDSNGINYITEYIEKAGPIEIKEWEENKEKRKIKEEILNELDNLNMDTLKIIKEIIERDRN